MKLRQQVKAFASVMEEKLRENNHKGGWCNCDPEWLLSRLREEAREVARRIKPAAGMVAWAVLTPTQQREIARECADVANFAMMIADVCGGLARAREAAGE